MKRTLQFGVTLAGLALFVMAVAPAAQALERNGTIRITTREVAHRVIDQGRRGRGPGNLEISRTCSTTRVSRRGRSDTARSSAPLPAGAPASATAPTSCRGARSWSPGRSSTASSTSGSAGGTRLYNNVQGSLTVTTTRPRRDILTFRLVV